MNSDGQIYRMKISTITGKLRSLMSTHRQRISRVFREAVVVAGGLLLTRLLAFLVSVIVARQAGAETFGEFTLFTTVFILASEIPNAFDTACIRFANSPDHKGLENEYLHMDLFAKFIYAALTGVIGWFVAPWLAQGVFEKPGATEAIRFAILSGGVFCIFTTLITSYQQKRNFLQLSLLRPLFNLFLIACVGGGILFGVAMTQQNLSYIYLIGAVLFAIIALVKMSGIIRVNQGDTKHLTRAYLSFGLLLLLSESVNLISARLDVFFIGAYLNYKELGLYGAALRISILMSVFSSMLTTVMLPRAASAGRDIASFRRYIGLAGIYAIVQVVAAIVIIVTMEQLIGLLFGLEYLVSSVAASWLVVQALFSSCTVPFQALIQCGGRPVHMFWVNGLKMLVNVLLLSLLIPIYKMNGAAVAVALSTLVTLLVSMAIVWRTCRPVDQMS